MSARFMILTNETPQLGDSSSALAGRFITIAMRESFYGREDLGLTHQLMGELPAIFKWALDSRDRLNARGYFVQPESAREAVEELTDVSSPVGAFIQEACELSHIAVIPASEVFEAWCRWCQQNGRDYPGTALAFGKALRAACPRVKQVRHRVDNRQVWHYEGEG